MPPVNQILDQRKNRRAKAGKDAKPRLALGASIFLSLCLAVLSLITVFVYRDITRDLPDINQLPGFLSPPDGKLLQPTRLYDRSGEHLLLVLQNPQAEDASLGGSIPTTVISSTIAIADPNFFYHAGYSWEGLTNGSHPTLAQKLVSDLLLTDETPGLRSALRERLLAARLTATYGRAQVLDWYLKSANYGRLAYGIEEASSLYFDHPASQLSLAEAALLAGVSQAPEMNPHDAPQAALERQKRVFQKLLDYRLVTPEEAIQAVQEKLGIRPAARSGQSLQVSDLLPNLAPAFVTQALRELDTILDRSRLERGGLRILTTLDFDVSNQANDAAAAQIARSETVTAEVVILDPQNGQILALVRQPASDQYDQGLQEHASGTLSIPFIYLTAFTQGLSPASLVWDTPSETGFASANPDIQYHGPVRLRLALVNDYQAAAEKTLQQVGGVNVRQIAAQFGLNHSGSDKTGFVSTQDFLGRLDLLQISRAFSIFANQGILAGKTEPANDHAPAKLTDIKPVTILSVTDTQLGEIYHVGSPQSLPVLTPQIAYLLTHILSDEPARWPSLGHPNSLELQQPAAVKLSQGFDKKDAWVIGYTPNRVISVWLGAGEEGSIQTPGDPGIIAGAAADLWKGVAQQTLAKTSYQPWNVPAGITTLEVCDPSGLLPSAECPNTVREVFLSGSEPQQMDTLYQKIRINRQTGYLATVFTPLDLVEERILMFVPEAEMGWMQTAGLPTPPEKYDTIPAEPQTWQGQRITSPSMFEAVGGMVAIQGEVGGQDLSFFRVQVGKGLNPGSWLQLGGDRASSTQQGVLETWDTSGLSGIYTIQLMVVRQNQNVQRSSVIITIDNQAPEIEILLPAAGEVSSAAQNGDLILRADVQDNLQIHEVVFFVDGIQIAAVNQPPFIAVWSPQEGEHHLRVLAVDQAGNQIEVERSFLVE